MELKLYQIKTGLNIIEVKTSSVIFFLNILNDIAIEGVNNYPAITVCPLPSFDKVSIKEFGYKGLYEYSRQGWMLERGTISLNSGSANQIILICTSSTTFLLDRGITGNGTFSGWAGSENENTSVDVINRNISMIKSVNECPKSKVYFENDGSKSETLNFYLTPSKHNQGSVGTEILECLEII